MDSCFPPLASLSLRGSSKSNKPNKNRHSTDGTTQNQSNLFYHHHHANEYGVRNNHTEIMPKLEVLQDLDLYYIRQIASSLKVNCTETTKTQQQQHQKNSLRKKPDFSFDFLLLLLFINLEIILCFFNLIYLFIHIWLLILLILKC